MYPVPALASTASIEIRKSVGPHLVRATTLIKLWGESIMSTLDNTLQARRAAVIERISRAAQAVSRDPTSVRLLAVSKSFGAEVVLQAIRAGQRSFGESYAQEGVEKIARVRELLGQAEKNGSPAEPLQWHFIGPLQSNKTRQVAEQFDWVESLDRIYVARRLADHRPPELAPLNVLIQVNISHEPRKAGVHAEHLAALARSVASIPRLKLRGVMAIPKPEIDPAQMRAPFRLMRRLFERLRENGHADLDTLSIGMSTDLEAAIAEGATEVRIGTAIFGERSGP